jgi:DNA-binding transcriptional LysR family regulator
MKAMRAGLSGQLDTAITDTVRGTVARERTMEFHQVRYFVALSKSLNFTRAAEVCNVTQPALTKAIQKLEYELGGELVFRERQLTQLTDLGRLVLPMLEQMLAAAAAVKLDARDFRQSAVAPIKIGLTPCLSAKLIVTVLSELATLVPGLQIDLVEAAESDMAHLLLDGTLSAAFAGGVQPLPERIDHWPLFDEGFQVLVSTQSPLADMTTIPLAILRDEIWLERLGCEAIKSLWQSCMPEAEPPHILHRGRQEAHLHQMVAAGLGIILAADHVDGPPHTVRRPIEGNPLRHHVKLLAVAGRRYTPALDALIKTSRHYAWTDRRPEAVETAAPRGAAHPIPAHVPAMLASAA